MASFFIVDRRLNPKGKSLANDEGIGLALSDSEEPC